MSKFQVDWNREPDLKELRRAYALKDSATQSFLFSMITLAERGSMAAKLYLGDYYDESSSEPGGISLAKHWFEKASAEGFAPAMFKLARVLLKEGDIVSARVVLERAASLDYAPALFKLALLVEKKANQIWLEQTRSYLKAASDLGHIPAKRDLASLLLKRPRGAGDVFFAIKLLVQFYATIPVMLQNMVLSKPFDERFLV